MNKLKKLARKIWYYFFPKKYATSIEQKSEEALIQRAKSRITLLMEIKNYIVNDLQIKEKSKFIPLRARRKACQMVQKKFGKQMREYNIVINVNLELKTV